MGAVAARSKLGAAARIVCGVDRELAVEAGRKP